MPSIINIINFVGVVSGINIAVLGLLFTLRSRFMDSWTKRFFELFFSLLILYALSNYFSQVSLTFLGKGYRGFSLAVIFLESFFASVLMPLLTVYILHLCGETLKCRLFYAVISLWCIYVILLIITQFSDFIYYITEDNKYIRGPFYPVLLICPAILMLLNLLGLLFRKDKFSSSKRKAFLLYLLIPTLSIFIQMAFYGLLIIVLGTAVSSFIIFFNIREEEVNSYIKQEIALYEQQFRMISLQMRPHFIYNTMSNIYYLCELDPQKAQTVVDNFTTYLKKNYSAMVKEGMVPFEDELEHTRAYLNVVKARYEELLFVEYDITERVFMLPPLTLEPIVENAVVHALDPDSEPLHIIIKTASTDEGSTLIVENSGTDFVLENDDDEPHIGLKNVRERLKTLCSGSLTISPREGGGTIVTIFVPWPFE